MIDGPQPLPDHFRCPTPVAVVGYGSQGAAWAANLSDSGVSVRVALRSGGPSWTRAKQEGHEVVTLEEAATLCPILCFLTPDETHAALVEGPLSGALPGSALVFAHGYNVHYGRVTGRPDQDLILVAPKGIGPQVRRTYLAGRGVPALLGVARDASGQAHGIARSIAEGLGCARVGIYPSSFREETECDLFSEQAVLCGGVPALVSAAFDTLVARGHSPEAAWFECLFELKLIVDLMVETGVAATFGRISTTAHFGAVRASGRLVDARLKATMETLLDEIQDGTFARALSDEVAQGSPSLRASQEAWSRCALEIVGRRVGPRIVGTPAGGKS